MGYVPVDDHQIITNKSEKRTYRIVWKIQNFSILSQEDELVNSLSSTFETGEGENSVGGKPVKWRMWLQKGTLNWANLYLKIEDCPDFPAVGWNMYGLFRFERRARDLDEPVYESLGRAHDWKKLRQRGLWIERWVDLEPDFVKTQLFEESLLISTVTIQLLFVSVNCPPPPSLETVVDQLQSKVSNKVKNSLHDAFKTGEIPFDVKIVTMDKQEFKAHWWLLKQSSSVFKTMYEVNLKERTSGVIEIQDVSGKTMGVIHHFLYSGELLPSWKDNDVIFELTNTAAMYDLKDLLEFLDGTLGNICTEDNAMMLLTLTQKLNLKTALKNIFNWVKGKSSSEDFLKLFSVMELSE